MGQLRRGYAPHAVSAARYARWSARYALVVARDYDTQLLESVAVRRARMREALLWGRTRRRFTSPTTPATSTMWKQRAEVAGEPES